MDEDGRLMSFIGLDRYRLEFDGTVDYVTVGNCHTGDYTISAWIKPDSVSDGTIYSGNGYEMLLRPSSGKLQMFAGGSGNKEITDDVCIVVDVWHYVVGTWDGSNVKLYVNGVLKSSSTTGTLDNPDVGAGMIGRHSTASQNFFNGSMGQVAIWNTVLTPAEVTTLYASGNRGADWTTMQNSSQVGHWRLGIDDIATGKSVVFDGVDETLIVGDGIGSNIDDFSIGFWNYIDDFDTGYQRIMVSGSPTTRIGWLTTGEMTFYVGDESDMDMTPTAVAKKWTHNVITYSRTGAYARHYVDGVLSDEKTGLIEDEKGGLDALYIASNANASLFYDGMISQFSVWNEVLTTTQISQMFLEGRHADWVTNYSSNLKGYWRMGSGDYDGNNHIIDNTATF